MTAKKLNRIVFWIIGTGLLAGAVVAVGLYKYSQSLVDRERWNLAYPVWQEIESLAPLTVIRFPKVYQGQWQSNDPVTQVRDYYDTMGFRFSVNRTGDKYVMTTRCQWRNGVYTQITLYNVGEKTFIQLTIVKEHLFGDFWRWMGQ